MDGDEAPRAGLGSGDRDRVAEHGGHPERVNGAHGVGDGATRPGHLDRSGRRGEWVGRPELTVAAKNDQIALLQFGEGRSGIGALGHGDPFQLISREGPAGLGEGSQRRQVHFPGRAGEARGGAALVQARATSSGHQ
jgi:hypothetical protein